ncbi:hypothetical protein SESBI_43550 [Sesbania bispinosa]|nr:hypothetical protein SESBI_43550 [Sesbania bispinosa]
MEFLFKGIVTTSFAAYVLSENLRESKGFNVEAEETYNEDLNNETEINLNEAKIEVTTYVTSSGANLT